MRWLRLNTANKQIYDEKWAVWSDMKIYGPKSRWLRDLIMSCLRNTTSCSVRDILDVGCGEGSNTNFLHEHFNCNATGIDISETGIQVSKNNYCDKSNMHFYTTEEMPIYEIDKKFDLVSCFEVLEHEDDWQTLLSQIIDVSRRYVLLSFPTGRMRPFEVHVGHVRNFKKGEVENFMFQNGFKAVYICYAGFPFYSPVYRNICNFFDISHAKFAGSGKYGLKQRMICSLTYAFFRYLSTQRKHGDAFCGLFELNDIVEMS